MSPTVQARLARSRGLALRLKLAGQTELAALVLEACDRVERSPVSDERASALAALVDGQA